MKIGFISCTKKKVSYKCQAENLYSLSSNFRYALKYCQGNYDKHFILSAKHGLLQPTDEIEPYDVTLNGASKAVILNWSESVLQQIISTISPGDDLFFHAGENYLKFLLPGLQGKGFTCTRPLKGVTMFDTPKWYKEKGVFLNNENF